MKPKKKPVSRQTQIRYATEHYSNALYDTYPDTETAIVEMAIFRDRCYANNQPRIAESIHLV